MRARSDGPSNGSGLTVHAIAGTDVVLLGMDLPADDVDGLLGFAVERTDHTEGERYHLPNFLLFAVNDHGDDPDRSSERNPFQEFVWGDYTAKPEHDYTYRVRAMYGQPGKLRPGAEAGVRVTTESQDDETHAIYFNRGVAGSQAYVRRFGSRRPDEVPGRAAYAWLSRGLEEGLRRFVARASDESYGLRAAVYEFEYQPVVDAFAVAASEGADVRIVFDAVRSKTGPAEDNRAAIEAAGLTARATPRTRTKISHNKFVVLLHRGRPIEVWTGSTNITEGGIFGHSNVGHAVRDPRVAARYLAYWEQLAGDPKGAQMKAWTEDATKLPAGLPRKGSVTTVFSPRKTLEALEWYARTMDRAGELGAAGPSVFLTAAFGVSDQLERVFEVDRDYLRYLLLDNTRGGVDTIRRDPDNRVVAGGYVGKGGWAQWAEERLTNLNGHVDFIHTKYMLINPLSDDPLVITGSANFSKASTTDNDENMLLIRGDGRVADVYLTEFMRLFNHFRLRARSGAKPRQLAPGPAANRGERRKLYLREDDAWARRFYVAGSPEEKERLLFR